MAKRRKKRAGRKKAAGKPGRKAKAPGRKRAARRASSGSGDLSLSELQAMLAARQSEIADLQRRRDDLGAELAKVDAELARHLGTRRGPGRPRKIATSVASAPAKGGKGRRPTGSMRGKLPELIRKVLSSSRKPMKLRDIAAGVVAAGYPTSSARFSVIVGQRIAEMKDVGKAGHGVYKLK